jgi:hypothetical protein
MADTKISGLTALTGANTASGDLLTIVDISDTTMAATGTNKKITLTELQSAPVSAGTANGVLYLNGSKVATSGSALVFDGSKLAINLATPDANLNVNGYTGNGTLRIGGATTGESVLYFADSGTGTGSYAGYLQYLHTSDALAFGAASDERMRLTSTGLGIGTSSPASRLDVANSGTPVIFSMTLTGAQRWQQIIDTTLGNWTLKDQTAGVNSLVAAAGTGNLGLGVTPSAWGAAAKTIEGVGGALTFFDGANDQLWLTQNAYWDGAWKYKTTNYATSFQQYLGSHVWFNAPSGTAGNAITFTQAMTLDASGNLLVGSTTGLASGLGVVVASSNSVSRVQLRNSTTGSATTDGGGIFMSGNDLGIENREASNIIFYNSGEVARIDSSGNLLVGATSTNPTNGFVANQNAGAGFYLQIGHPTGTGSGVAYSRFMYNQTEIGSITQSGTTAVLYNTTSDQRLKENIANADSASSLIDSLQVRKFDWKADGSHQRYGFIAQELVSVAPEAVHQPINPEEMMAVDYSKLVPMLVKEIQSLRARVAALES